VSVTLRADHLAALPADERAAVLAALTDAEVLALAHDWRFWARPDQVAPALPWDVWLILAGRGYGKTRCGSEWVREEVERAERFILVAPTAADVRDTMIEGESGLLAVFPPDQQPEYQASRRRIEFHNGAFALLFSGDEPDRLRGPQAERAWVDEMAAMRYGPAVWPAARQRPAGAGHDDAEALEVVAR
jgi:phage terminase large subunit-like protein